MIIDDLPSISIANDSDEIAIEQGTATKKITKGNFLQEVTSAISSLLSSLSGKVSKSGDTMTGNLEIDESDPSVFLKNTGADTSRSSDEIIRAWTFGAKDKNNKYAAYWQSTFQTNGRMNTALSARRIVGGLSVDNTITLKINNDGTRLVSLSDPAVWRDALGLGEIVYGTNTSSNVSIPSSTATEFSSLTLTKGVWIVIACADWAANGSGYRQIATADVTNPTRQNATTVVGLSGKEVYQQLTMIRPIAGASSNIVFYALQNSGGALNIYPYVYAVRVG